MISPHSPPGTIVVCRLEGRSYNAANGIKDSPLRVGQKYTVTSIGKKGDGVWQGQITHSDFYANLAELPQYVFCLSLLDYPALPECLTSLLNTKPVDDPYVEAIETLRAGKN